MDLVPYIAVGVLVAAGIAFAFFLGWVSGKEARDREAAIRELEQRERDRRQGGEGTRAA